jgi:hypothetical protein
MEDFIGESIFTLLGALIRWSVGKLFGSNRTFGSYCDDHGTNLALSFVLVIGGALLYNWYKV